MDGIDWQNGHCKNQFWKEVWPAFFFWCNHTSPPIAQYLRRTPDTVTPAREREKGKHFQASRRKEGGKGGGTNYTSLPDSKFGGWLPSAKVRATSKLYSSLTFVGLSIFIHDFISIGGSGHMCGPEYATSSRPGLWGCKKGQQSFIVTHPLHHFDLSEYTYAPPGWSHFSEINKHIREKRAARYDEVGIHPFWWRRLAIENRIWRTDSSDLLMCLMQIIPPCIGN